MGRGGGTSPRRLHDLHCRTSLDSVAWLFVPLGRTCAGKSLIMACLRKICLIFAGAIHGTETGHTRLKSRMRQATRRACHRSLCLSKLASYKKNRPPTRHPGWNWGRGAGDRFEVPKEMLEITPTGISASQGCEKGKGSRSLTPYQGYSSTNLKNIGTFNNRLNLGYRQCEAAKQCH